MSEASQRPNTEVPQPAHAETGGLVAAARQELVGDLVSKELISEDFARSDALEAFSIDESLGRDALPHILVGDDYGGGHHLPTMLAVGREGTHAASILMRPDNPKKNRAYYRNEQKVRENGVFEAKTVSIMGSDGEPHKKASGSVFFPNEWSTQKVLESIIEASREPGEHKPDSHAYTHIKEVDGVKVIVNTDDMTGKIVAARPGKK